MVIRFSIYYHTPESGDYLRQIVNSSGAGRLVATGDLDHLPLQGENGADIIFLEYQEGNPDLDQWIEKIAANPQNPPIFLYFKEISTSCLWKALRLGAKECFAYPVDEEEFRQTATRVLARAAIHGGADRTTRVVAFLGCKGGVGTTLVAANEAFALSQEHHDEILLVDLDLRYGQLSYFFNVQPQHTLADLVRNVERLDSNYLRSIFHCYANNFYLLPAPVRIEEADAITPGHLEQILRYLKNQLGFSWILLDCGHQVDEFSLRALELADELELVTNATIPALSNTRKILEFLKLLDLHDLKTGIWINSWEKQGDLSLVEVENFLGAKISGTLLFARKEVEQSINEGKPLLEIAPRHPLCEDLRKMAANIRGSENGGATRNSRGGWLSRWWGKG